MKNTRRTAKKKRRARKNRAAGWVILVILMLIAAGIVYLRGTVETDNRQLPEIPLDGSETGNGNAASAGNTEAPGLTTDAGKPAAGEKEAENVVVPAAAGNGGNGNGYGAQPAKSTPTPAVQPPVYYPASDPTDETENETAASGETQTSPATPAPSAAPTPNPATPAPSVPPAQTQNEDNEPLIISLGENELPLF